MITQLAETKPIECDDLRDKIKLEVSPYYFKVIVGKKTWYWKKDTGEFDGTSFKVVED